MVESWDCWSLSSPLLPMASSLACSGDLRLQGMKKEPVKNLRCLSFWCCISSVWTATTLGQDNTSAKIISLIPTNESLLSPLPFNSHYCTCWWCWSFQSASHQYSQFLKQTDKESHFTRPECFSPNYTPLYGLLTSRAGTPGTWRAKIIIPA